MLYCPSGRQLAELERWIEDWNQNVGAKEAVKIIPLRRTGYLTLDIQIPDPHLGPDTGTTRPNTQETEDAFGHPIPNKTDDYGQYSLPPDAAAQLFPACHRKPVVARLVASRL
jgi:hypothetical protein